MPRTAQPQLSRPLSERIWSQPSAQQFDRAMSSDQVQQFLQLYEQARSREVEGIAFLTLPTADTPNVVADLAKPHLWFSGAVCLGFDGLPEIYLTWDQQGDDIALRVTTQKLWRRFSLDRISMSPEAPWDFFSRSRLTGMQLFTNATVSDGKVIAASLNFTKDDQTNPLWIATCNRHNIGDGDDLFVGVSLPENTSNLTLVHDTAS